MPVSTVSTRSALRSAARGDLVVPRTRRRLGNRAISVAGPAAWNSLPPDIRTASTLCTFKNLLKTHLFLHSFDECTVGAKRPQTLRPSQTTWAASPPVCCQSLHPPLPSIVITQPESRYSLDHPAEGRRLSRPSWLVTYRDGLPAHRRSPILVLTGSDVAQLR